MNGATSKIENPKKDSDEKSTSMFRNNLQFRTKDLILLMHFAVTQTT